VRAALASGWKAEQFLVSSFHLPELREFKRRVPEVALGVLLCGVPLDLAAAATELGAQAVSLDRDFADPALIADAHARGMKVFVFTVNEREDIARFRAAGVDGIFTDFPERAA
jgi:glycerophosphoryl diester phosphodiesterase